jgi:CBS domain containing-hemolysin-like protein
MVPRTEIESIDVHASVKELAELFQETKLSRLLVIDEDIDNVLGYVHHQQLFEEPKNIRQLIMDIPFVPEVMRVTELMNKLIKEKMSIACVVDEFGGVSGIIALEDILEEIFGEIEDEHDQEATFPYGIPLFWPPGDRLPQREIQTLSSGRRIPYAVGVSGDDYRRHPRARSDH